MRDFVSGARRDSQHLNGDVTISRDAPCRRERREDASRELERDREDEHVGIALHTSPASNRSDHSPE